jgi:anti-sigma B factor antagonist
MEIEVITLENDVNCIRLSGRMDSAGVDRVEIKFTSALVAPGRNAVVDLSAVSFLASMGIRMLITGARSLKAKGAKVVVFGATELVQGVLENVALDQIIPIASTQEQALEKLSS